MASDSSPRPIPQQSPSFAPFSQLPDSAGEDLRTRFFNQYQPSGPTEQTIFEQLVHAAFCLRQVQAREITLLSEHIEKPVDFARVLNALSRCRASHERSFQAAIENLKRAQTERFLHAKLTRQFPNETLPLALHLPTLKSNCADRSSWRRGKVTSIFQHAAAGDACPPSPTSPQESPPSRASRSGLRTIQQSG